MANLRQFLFKKYASEGRDKVVLELKGLYEPKKGDRFHISGITYEIGQVVLIDDGIEFEISSKIPLDEVAGQEGARNFFEAVKKIVLDSPKDPDYAGMDDIVHKMGEREVKKRDYVRLRYRYTSSELYDEQKIIREVEEIKRGESSREILPIPGIASIAGQLVLMNLKESAYEYIKQNMIRLIEANERVRKEAAKN
jgi:hypothetical protein